MWRTILTWLLGVFENISDFATWLFQPFDIHIESDSELLNMMFGSIFEWINSIATWKPVDIFGIGLFVFLIGLGIFKLVA